MDCGHRGVVAEIGGGFGLIARLNAIGIMPGKEIIKISFIMGRGPLTIQVNRVQVAIRGGVLEAIMHLVKR